MQKAFITGGSGYVGRNLIRELKSRGWEINALARSDNSAQIVEDLGANAIRGDLQSLEAMEDGMQGCGVVFHSAAWIDDWGDYEEAYHINVTGTQNVIVAARSADVPKFVHVSTEAVLVSADVKQYVDVDETFPRPNNPLGLYPITKGKAEEVVLAANSDQFQTVIIRPRFIWGRDDTTLLPRLVEATKTGQLMWFNGGNYRFSTTHIDNCIEGLMLGYEKGQGGEIYFVTDGEPVIFKEFISEMLKTQDVKPPKRSIPFSLANGIASVLELGWKTLPLPGSPPLHRSILRLIGVEFSIDDSKARSELGYTSHRTVEEGLAMLRQATEEK